MLQRCFLQHALTKAVRWRNRKLGKTESSAYCIAYESDVLNRVSLNPLL